MAAGPKRAARSRTKTETSPEKTKPKAPAASTPDEKLGRALKKAISALLDRKAEKIAVLNLSGLTSMTDYFVLASATNTRQAQALADAVETAMKDEKVRPISIEGYQTATWILLDFGDVVFHIFEDEARRFYGLERLWGDAPDLTGNFA
ncbi:MAG: ribosome silencing factor [Acidobacteria bacterium]|nr:ribosome silencing factor [Acidobacteriota bacterium]MCK6681129.1 ribosome silencing factor [Thermoanaerobaculia bacterium]